MRKTVVVYLLAILAAQSTAFGINPRALTNEDPLTSATATSDTPAPVPASDCQVIHHVWPDYLASSNRCCIEPEIVCSGDHVVRIDFVPGTRTGLLPDFSSLTQLTYIYLNGNNLTGTIPNLPPNLLYLNIGNNLLTDVIPFDLPPMLETFIAGHNQLSGTIPTSISNLTDLILFDVSYNLLAGEIPSLPLLMTAEVDLSDIAANFRGNCFTNAAAFDVMNSPNCSSDPVGEGRSVTTQIIYPTTATERIYIRPISKTMNTLTLTLGTNTQALETTSELLAPTIETTDGILRIGFITTSTITQPLQTFTQRTTTNLQSIDDGPIVISIGASYLLTGSTPTFSIDSVTTVPGGSIPHPNPPAPPTDPTANPVVIAGGIAGGLVALILVAVMGAYRIRQDSTDPEVVKVEYFEPKYDPSDTPDSSPPELVDMKAEFGYGAQDLPTPPMEKEGGRKPMAGRIWGTR